MTHRAREPGMKIEPLCYQLDHYYGNKVLDVLGPYEKLHEHLLGRRKEKHSFIISYPHVQRLFQEILLQREET